MPFPEDQYKAKILPLQDLYDGVVLKSDHGIIVPDYQREFNWDVELVERLYLSVLIALNRDDNVNDFEPIFLGSWIICGVEEPNSSFNGEEFDLIDGQQRLTTLTLLSFAIVYSLLQSEEVIDQTSKLTNEQKHSLSAEISDLCEKLMKMLVGKTERRDQVFKFPRIVRDIDQRDETFERTTIRSPIAKFIQSAQSYYSRQSQFLNLAPITDQDRTGERLVECFSHLQENIKRISDKDFYDESEAVYTNPEKLSRSRYTNLLQEIRSADRQNIVQRCAQDPELEQIIRVIYLGNFLRKYVGISLIKCSTMDAAFDIFDSLNSTGLPLSAIETFKPQLIKQFRQKRVSYQSSGAEKSFDEIDEIFKTYRSAKQQDESKKIVTAACYLLNGDKVPEKLFEQRQKLRTMQTYFTEKSQMDAVPEALATITKFRSIFFSNTAAKIDSALVGLDDNEKDEIKVFCDLLAASKTILVIPSLARAWSAGLRSNNHTYFYQLLKSIVAYFALRRFASGGTDGIDTRFRNLVAGAGSTNFKGFTIDTVEDNELPDIADVNAYFTSQLNCKNLRFDLNSKDQWVNHVSQQAIYNFSRPLTKFLLMVGHTHTKIEASGLPTRDDTIASDDRDFLSWTKWNSEIYATIEHVAPQQGAREDWPGVYDNPNLKNCLGNLVLLPGLQNSQIGNDSWNKKRLFFDMLTENSKSSRENALRQAESAGIRFNKKISESLTQATRSSMLDGVSAQPVWDATYVQKRSERLSELCWDSFVSWLN